MFWGVFYLQFWIDHMDDFPVSMKSSILPDCPVLAKVLRLSETGHNIYVYRDS